MKSSALESIQYKILSLDDFKEKKDIFYNKKIVFTNGCFDILHLGHVEYLAKAKDLGDILVVGLNSDVSVKRLKGEQRPVNPEHARATVLAALSMVDFVIVFEEDTPYNLINNILPDYLVKGGDYAAGEIVGADTVNNKGGEVVIIPLTDGFSTTKTIESMVVNNT
ncbi:MAG: D-glycero-beta-D-manno-heptose 1-phosphate adenylyltransferase [Bacteroidales bacterium]|jgi:D-beta-D-heptose 7-phosphate kinase/D-beta-D-heptose 1-phosphate adenosyltransferase|nr:D-glycero-beta-D-manno-heptose 1-phosphate adenylyltransferase [Bacteroidales bacterium]